MLKRKSAVQSRGESAKKLQTVDLIKEGKITRESMQLVDFLTDQFGEEQLYYCWGDGDTDSFVFRGLNKLTDKERDHFDVYWLDYIYYGYSLNNDNCETKESSLAIDNGWHVGCLYRNDL